MTGGSCALVALRVIILTCSSSITRDLQKNIFGVREFQSAGMYLKWVREFEMREFKPAQKLVLREMLYT